LSLLLLQVSYDPDFVCLDCPNHWVAGMGMDTNQRFRSLDYVAVLKPEAIQRALHA
jgi:hypoxanthine-guanine phosphoribosyltransferase